MIITHKCVTCQHPQIWGNRKTHPVLGLTDPTHCGQTGCLCHGRKCTWGPSTAITRFHADGTVVDEVLTLADVIRPGSPLPFYTAGQACDCADCNALYTQLTAHLEGATAP